MLLETDRLRMRQLTGEDAEFVLTLIQEPEFLEHIGDKGVHDLESAREFVRTGPWTNQPKRGLGQFLIEEKATGAPVGVCGLLYRERLDVTDVGFAILSANRGRGYATEAAAAVLEYGRNTLGLQGIVALTSEANTPSIRVLEKLGMSFVTIVTMSDDDPGTALYS
jgi:RimJ/RimL family protein N-acetyltransferase